MRNHRIFFIIFIKLSIKKSTSSFVFSFPKVILKLPLSNTGGTFIAVKTWDGFNLPALQADPLEAQIPVPVIIYFYLHL